MVGFAVCMGKGIGSPARSGRFIKLMQTISYFFVHTGNPGSRLFTARVR